MEFSTKFNVGDVIYAIEFDSNSGYQINPMPLEVMGITVKIFRNDISVKYHTNKNKGGSFEFVRVDEELACESIEEANAMSVQLREKQ